MEIEENSELDKQLINIITRYYHFEQEKEKFLMNHDNIFLTNKDYYLVDKLIIDKIKNFTEYDKIKEKFNYNLNGKEKDEEIIKNYLNTLNKNEGTNLFSELNNFKIDKNILLKELLENKKFPFEIINEEVKNSLNLLNYEFPKINGKSTNNKIIFELESLINNEKLIIVLFNIGNFNLLELFYVLDYSMTIEEFLKIIDKNQYEDILKELEINIDNIDEKGELREIKGDIHNYHLMVRKINLDNINKIKSSLIQKNNEAEYLNQEHNNIQNIFKSLYKSNKIYQKALNNEEIRGNYSPCKLINIEWVENLKNIFSYKEINDNFSYDENYDKNNLGIFKDIKKLYPENVENGNFFICRELFFISLNSFVNELENSKDFLDYHIFLENNKGAIMIKNEIYIFETINNDVNQRKNFKKIINNQIRQIMVKDSYNFDKNDSNELFNIFSNNNNKGHEHIVYDSNNINNSNNEIKAEFNTNIIDSDIKGNKNSLLIQNKINIINNDNNYINNNNIIMTKENVINYFYILFNREQMLNKRRQELELLEKNQIKLNRVVLDKLQPTLGLENIGATCYMNAPLQCMAHCIEVSEEILTWYNNNMDNKKKSKELSYAFAEVLDNIFLKRNNKKFFSPNRFKQVISKNSLFKGIQANDSKDILNYLIEELHKELNDLYEPDANNDMNENIIVDQRDQMAIFNYFMKSYRKNYHSIISNYLYGIQKTITKCSFCGTMIYNFQAYSFLIFPLLEVKKFVIINNFVNPFFNFQNYILNIFDCFNYFRKIDFFTGPNQIHCNQCNCLRDAYYCNVLYSAPLILCIVLNRGKNNEDFKEKFNFSTELNLSNYVDENSNFAKYYLIGVVCHIGDSSMSGHFFSYCRSHKNSPWYKYNDSIVTPCDENEILGAFTPYILFYHRYT